MASIDGPAARPSPRISDNGEAVGLTIGTVPWGSQIPPPIASVSGPVTT